MRTNEQILEASTEMEPVLGTVDLDIPAEVMWQIFDQPKLWPRWNRCMFWAANSRLEAGRNLVWAFEPLRWQYLYKLIGIARLVEVEPGERVTWEVTALPGLYARHTYFVEDLGNGRCRFGSYEKAMGPTFRLLKRFWLAHFEFVKDRSLQGGRLLECLYRGNGRLDQTVLKRRGLLSWLREWTASATLLRMPIISLAPGVYAALGGGGNSLIVADGGEVLLVDSKMRPFSGRLKRWIERNLQAPVTTVVNTHFHYDHTFGNIHYPQARLIAHTSAPDLMRRRDGRWWQRNPAGIPRSENLVAERLLVQVGGQEVEIHHSGQGHTASDLWLYLRRGDTEIIATGDVASLGIYPFLDRGEGGADVLGMVRLLRYWAETYPQALFVPGHGPVATAADLLAHADYLSFLYDSVTAARADGFSRQETARHIDLKQFELMTVPIFHYGETVIRQHSNIDVAYQLQQQGE